MFTPHLKYKGDLNLFRVCFSFLVLFYGSQSFQFLHFHHHHTNDSLHIEVSYHPLDLKVEHSSAHHHPEGKTSNSKESQHKYESQIDWTIIRSQSVNQLLSSDEQDPILSKADRPELGFSHSGSCCGEFFFWIKYFRFFTPVRGPPQFI